MLDTQERLAPVLVTEEFLPTAGLGSGPGSGIVACLGSGILNTTITNRLIYMFCSPIEH